MQALKYLVLNVANPRPIFVKPPKSLLPLLLVVSLLDMLSVQISKAEDFIGPEKSFLPKNLISKPMPRRMQQASLSPTQNSKKHKASERSYGPPAEWRSQKKIRT